MPPRLSPLDATLRDRLDRLDREHLRRRLREIDSPQGIHLATPSGPLLNFSSNDYLGLAHHPAVREAAHAALREFGAGAGASRLICGSLAPFHRLEAELAAFKQTPAALAFASGYAAALGTIPALVGPGDYVLLDRLSHACLVDGARLSGAKLRVFRHNDVADLECRLRWALEDRQTHPPAPDRGHILVVTESVFSMDGDRAPLREIADLKERDGAWLMVDEAHATGVLGPGRRGAIEELGLTGRVEVALGTLGKALGAAGGFIAGSAALCDWLVNRARSFVFSTAPAPAAAAAALAGVQIAGSDEGRSLAERLWRSVHRLHEGLREDGWSLPPAASPILPLIVGDEETALRLAAALRDESVLVPAIRYPTVSRGRARLRITVSAAHDPEHLERLRTSLKRAAQRAGFRFP